MPLIVTPDDITQALTRTDASADNIDRAVDACEALPKLTRDQWKTWLHGSDGKGGYRAFSRANKNLSFFSLGLPNIADQAVAYEHELDSWNKTIASSCFNPQPAPVAHDEIAGANSRNMLPTVSGTTKALIVGGFAAGLFLLFKVVR